MNKELCKCGFEPHPNVPCSEVIQVANKVDGEYFRLINTILEKGRVKHNRTGIDTIGVFGEQAKYNIDLNAFPILTTKKVWFKGIVHELLWFIKGDTNIKYLVDNDVHIWDEWAFQKFLKNTNQDSEEREYINNQEQFIYHIKESYEFAEKWGELGKGTYGGMWRDFPSDVRELNGTHVLGVDQLENIIHKLKNNSDDRRMIVSAWHPYWVDHCALPPCHCLFQFNTEELTIEERYTYANSVGLNLAVAVTDGVLDESECNRILEKYMIPKRRLNCLLYQRSVDTALGKPFNLTSYSLLTAMIAQCVNMIPGTFIHSMGDAHIYTNHLDGIKEQLSREPMKLPKLWLNPEVRNLFDFKYEDVKLEGYHPHPTIKMDVAV